MGASPEHREPKTKAPAPAGRDLAGAQAGSAQAGAYKYTWGPLTDVPEKSTYDHAMSWIEPGSQVLDVGSGPGFFASVLSDRLNCEVDCVEYNQEAAEKAAKVCRQVFQLDLQSPNWADALTRRYDYVVLLDVLEHMSDPVRMLLAARELLADGGRLIASVPNVAHAAVRLPLLLGQWDYEQSGILDDSHLKFFVRDTFVDTIANGGFAVETLERVHRTVSDDWLKDAASSLRSSVGDIERLLTSTEGYTWQFIALAAPSDFPGAVAAKEGTVDRSADLMEQLRSTRAELASYERRFGWLKKIRASMRRDSGSTR